MTPESYNKQSEQLKMAKKEEIEICNMNCRYVVNIIIASVLGLFIKDSVSANTSVRPDILDFCMTSLLFVILLAAIGFYWLDSWRRFKYADKARKELDKLITGETTDDTAITDNMNTLSDRLFPLFRYQLYMCGLMVALLLAYIVLGFFNRA